MWTRGELKNQAKASLRNKYWPAFAVTLIVSLLGSGSGMFTWRFNLSDFRRTDNVERWFSDPFHTFRDFSDFPFRDLLSSRIIFLAVLVGLFAGLIGLAYSLLVRPVIQVGGNRWFSRSREAAATPTIGQVFSLFRAGRYLKTVGSMLWMNLFLFLWGLLALIPTVLLIILASIRLIDLQVFRRGQTITEDMLAAMFWQAAPLLLLWLFASIAFSIPAIVKSYSYRMTPWILADNPQIGHRRSLKLSMDLTRGHKLDIFVLDLSFIGWFILGALACGLGVFFVLPYYQAVQAELFATLRHLGVKNGLCSMEEFGFVRIADPGVDAQAESLNLEI